MRDERADPVTSWNVFTKPWPTPSAGALAELVAGLGFDGVELPVRAGFQVTPDDAEAQLPGFVAALRAGGIATTSVATELSARGIRWCAAAGVPFLRVMAPIGEAGYRAGERAFRTLLDELVPICLDVGVRIGVQQHHGRYVSTSAGLRALLAGYPAEGVCAVWDAAHSALAGERPADGLDQVVDHLGMVNLKNAYYHRDDAPQDAPTWQPRFVTGPLGLSRWADVAAAVRSLDFTGPFCLTAQYSAGVGDVEALLPGDLAYARSLFALTPAPAISPPRDDPSGPDAQE